MKIEMPDIFGLKAVTQNKKKKQYILNDLDDDAGSQRTDSPDLHIRRFILYFVKNAQYIQYAKHGTSLIMTNTRENYRRLRKNWQALVFTENSSICICRFAST
jgi:hypothetical protein